MRHFLDAIANALASLAPVPAPGTARPRTPQDDLRALAGDWQRVGQALAHALGHPDPVSPARDCRPPD